MNFRALMLPAVALACGTAGFVAYRSWVMPGATIVGTPVSVQTANDTTDAPAAPAVPEAVPNIRLKDLSGRAHPLAEFKGAPTIYNFWATWCAPCRREIPLLNQLYAAHRAEKLQLVGVALDFREDVQKFLKSTPIAYTVLVAEQDGAVVATQFGMELVLPFSVFANGAGQIIAVKVGELHLNEANAILGALKSLEAGKLGLAAARAQISAQLRQFSIERAASGR
jgi:thiol-disulfide isomerase/thioredoxin